MFRIWMPHQNLGCFGVELFNPWNNAKVLYADLFFSSNEPRIFLRIETIAKWTIGLFFIRRWR